MNELINLMYQIKDLSTRTNEIALIDLQPRLMAVYDKLEAEKLILSGVSQHREQLLAVAEYVYDHFDDSSSKTAKDYLQEFLRQ